MPRPRITGRGASSAPPERRRPLPGLGRDRATQIFRSHGLAAIAILAILSAIFAVMDPFVGGNPPVSVAIPGHIPDFELYRRIVADISGGQPYYAAAVRELTTNHMAVRPVATIRLPTLALLSAAIGPVALNIVHMAIAGAAALVWCIRLRRRNPIIVALAIALGWRWAFEPSLLVMHETWAGMLAILALGLRTERSWGPSLAAGMLACAFRETAIVLPLVMILAAAIERRWRETAGWIAGLLIVGAGYAWHADLATAAASAVPDSGLRTHWWTHQGPFFAFGATLYVTGLAFPLIPKLLAYAAAFAGCLGWIRSDAPASRRVAGYILVWLVVMAICAGAKNFYWAAMYAALVPLGAALLSPEVSRAPHGSPDNA